MKLLSKLLVLVTLAAVVLAFLTERENDRYRDFFKHYIALDLED